MHNIALSIVDIHWPRDTVRLVPALARAGYQRCWLTEHHSPRQSGSPAVLAAAVASAQTSILVGTAAILLRFASPVKVVEDFRLLELLFPDRIDLGVASGGPRDPMRRHLLDGRTDPDWETFARKVRALATLLDGQPSDGVDGAAVGPAAGGGGPRLWVCGLTTSAGELAAAVGARFAFSEHMRRNLPAGDDVGRRSIEVYRERYANRGSRSEVSVACYGVCSDSRRRAVQVWDEYCASRGKRLRPTFIGSPSECAEQLEDVAASYCGDELALCTLSDDPALRLESYGLVAEALQSNRSREGNRAPAGGERAPLRSRR